MKSNCKKCNVVKGLHTTNLKTEGYCIAKILGAVMDMIAELPTNAFRVEYLSEKKAYALGINRWLQIRNKRFRISNEALEAKYLQLVDILNKRYPRSIEQTPFEKYIIKKIRVSTKLQIRRSYWIGPFNFDLFFGQLGELGASSMRGLAIEVDGSIHDVQIKMSKDQIRYNMLHALKIGLHPVDNREVNSKTESDFISKIKSIRRLDHRARKRLLWDIHLFTLCCHLKDHELADFLMEKPETLFKFSLDQLEEVL